MDHELEGKKQIDLTTDKPYHRGHHHIVTNVLSDRFTALWSTRIWNLLHPTKQGGRYWLIEIDGRRALFCMASSPPACTADLGAPRDGPSAIAYGSLTAVRRPRKQAFVPVSDAGRHHQMGQRRTWQRSFERAR